RIILLRDYYKVPPRKDKVSRENIFQRDNYHCVYCGKKFPSSKLTLDHVIPRSRWEHVPKKERPKEFNSWENLVAACKNCNTRKGNKLLTELKWNLPEENRVTPKLRFPLFSITDQQAEKFGWREYISF
ncbi:HNH endonuclease, partial [Leptospira interrogans]